MVEDGAVHSLIRKRRGEGWDYKSRAATSCQELRLTSVLTAGPKVSFKTFFSRCRQWEGFQTGGEHEYPHLYLVFDFKRPPCGCSDMALDLCHFMTDQGVIATEDIL